MSGSINLVWRSSFGPIAGMSDRAVLSRRHRFRAHTRLAPQRLATAFALSVGWLLLLGCGPAYPYVPFPPRVTPALGELREGHASIDVLYATDRRHTGSDEPGLFYGIDRSNEVSLGRCEVSIPRDHGRGRLTPPGLLEKPDPRKHVLLTGVDPPIDETAFLDLLKTRARLSPRHEVLVFIHGYAVTFADAARRTGQLAHDTRLDGVPVAYSWPAQGFLSSYLVDRENADWTVPHLVELLRSLAATPELERVHLMAHSMGSRVLSDALREFARGVADGEPPAFHQIVLAAADMDSEIFARDYVPGYLRCSRRLTLYVSGADWALGGSQRLHRYRRLGQGVPRELLESWRDRVDVVDVTREDRGYIGHLYYGNSPRVLSDLEQLFLDQLPVERGLVRQQGYFEFSTLQQIEALRGGAGS